MTEENGQKRAVAFIDGSNTRLAARKAFGEAYAIYNPLALAQLVCEQQGLELAGVRFYLGVPDLRVTEDGHYAWMKRCARWRRQGVEVLTRILRQDDEGVAREKGIDLRLALDAVALFRRKPFDVALLFSQDQDFAELADELQHLAVEQSHPVRVVSVIPWSGRLPPAVGIRGTNLVIMDRDLFGSALDDADNRRRRFVASDSDAAVVESFADAAATDTDTDADAVAEGIEDDIIPSAAPAVTPQRVIALPQAPAAPRRKIGWRLAGIVAGLYLLAATFTFADQIWQSRDAVFAPLDPATDSLARAETLLGLAERALVWPKVWLDPDRYRVVSRAVSHLDFRPIRTYASDVIAKLNP